MYLAGLVDPNLQAVLQVENYIVQLYIRDLEFSAQIYYPKANFRIAKPKHVNPKPFQQIMKFSTISMSSARHNSTMA